LLRRENRFERTASSLARLLPFLIAFTCLVLVLNAPAAQATQRARATLSPTTRLCPEWHLAADHSAVEAAPSLCRRALKITQAFSYPASVDPVMVLHETGDHQVSDPATPGSAPQDTSLASKRLITVRLRGPPA
jgi:hypothetical protein